MSDELSTEARALIDAAREQDVPPPGEKARLRAAVDSAVRASASGSTGWVPKGVGAVVLAAAAGGLLFAFWPRPARPPKAPVEAKLAPAPVLPTTPTAPPVPSPPIARHAKPLAPPSAPEAPPPPAPPAPNTLDEELRLMSGAQEALRQEQPERAMALIAEHAARFPNGELRQERAAVHILALCALGKEDEARQEARRFYSEAPQSPLLGRVRDSCAGEE